MYAQSQFVTQQIDEELRIETIFGCPSKIAIANATTTAYLRTLEIDTTSVVYSSSVFSNEQFHTLEVFTMYFHVYFIVIDLTAFKVMPGVQKRQ